MRNPLPTWQEMGQGRCWARSCSEARLAVIIPFFPTHHRSPLHSRAHGCLSVPLTTPWQVLRANPCTYEAPPGGYRYLLIELRSEPPRGQRGDHLVRSEASRAVRNEGRRAVRRGPVGPCRLVFHHKFVCLACSHSCIMFMVDIPNNWQRISNRYEGRESIPVKPVTSQNRYI